MPATPIANTAPGSADPALAGPSSIRFAYGLTKAEMARGRYAAGEGITGAVLATGQAMIVQDIDAEPRFLARAVERSKLPQETVALIALPIDVNRRTVGVLGVHRIRRRHRLLNDGVAVLKILATLAGQLLQLRSLVEEKTRNGFHGANASSLRPRFQGRRPPRTTGRQLSLHGSGWSRPL